MKISKIEDNKKRYMSLLFLADEQEDMIDRYLEKGTMYVLEECQRMGYGKRMIEFIEQTYRDNFRILRVGTGDSQLTLPFYKKCGFIESHRIKNFFTDNYDHPIFECGVQLIDMVYLEKNLLWKSNTIHRKKQMEYLAFCK